MGFSDRAKLTALAIVHVFETSKPFGDYSAVAVLNDGAGISYGASQFTHRSGSLAAVVQRYIKIAGEAPSVVTSALPDLISRKNISKQSLNNSLKSALRRLGKTPEMQRAQREIAFEKYLKPAIDACDGSKFVLPLSLAVIYDSINHGSWERIRDRVKIPPVEKSWITEYVRKRDAWLESVPRLAVTDYRTDFFLAQIARGNWNLSLPLNVHGCKLTEEMLFPNTDSAAAQTTAADAQTAGDGVPATSEIPIGGPDSTEQPPNLPVIEQKTVEASDGQAVTTTQAAPGTNPHTDEPAQVSQGGPISRWIAGMGGTAGLITAVSGFITANTSLIAVGIVCVTVLILALIFRTAILDAIRMQTAADSNKYNVK